MAFTMMPTSAANNTVKSTRNMKKVVATAPVSSLDTAAETGSSPVQDAKICKRRTLYKSFYLTETH